MSFMCCFAPSVREPHSSPHVQPTAQWKHPPQTNRNTNSKTALGLPPQNSTDSSDSTQDSAWIKPSKRGSQAGRQGEQLPSGHTEERTDQVGNTDQQQTHQASKPNLPQIVSSSSLGTGTESALLTQPSGQPRLSLPSAPSSFKDDNRSASARSAATLALNNSRSASGEAPPDSTAAIKPAGSGPCAPPNSSPFQYATRLPGLQTQASVPTTWSTLHSAASGGMSRPVSSSALVAMQSGTTSPGSRQIRIKGKPVWRKLGSMLRGSDLESCPSDETNMHGSRSAALTAYGSNGSIAGGGSAAWSRSASGGSLLNASLNRVGSMRHLQLPEGGAEGDGVAAAATAVEAVCRQFAEQFVKALLTGNASWGSMPEIGSILDEACEMIAHDGQTYVGRAAIIRRLNKGMEQFLKMLGVTGEEDGETAMAMAARAGKIESSLEVVNLSKTPHGSSGKLARARSTGGSGRSTPGIPTGKATTSSVVVVTYTFKAGLRKFKLQDRFKVRRGLICRLRRLRL